MKPTCTGGILSAILLTLVLSGGRSQAGPVPIEGSMGPGLQRIAAEHPDQDLLVWVFFRDKGFSDEGELQAALNRVSSGWSDAVKQRRRTAGSSGRPDVTDLPLHRPYVEQVRSAGVRLRRESRWLNAVSVQATGAQLRTLASLPAVRFVQPVLVSKTPPEPVETGRGLTGLAGAIGDSLELDFYGPSYLQLDMIQALDLHREGYTGAGVKVMLLDTGFKSSHPAFNLCTDLADEYDFVFDDGVTENEIGDHPSQHNHGTGVWGTLGGYAPGELIGPAWASTFYLGKTEDIVNEVHAEEDNYVAALEWADTLGVDVVSASLAYLVFDSGGSYTYADLDGDTAVITVAVDLAVGKGLCVVNAMGNTGPGAGSLWTPADADSVIACGAVNGAGTIASFSARGPTADGRIKPEICARGVGTIWAVAGTDAYGFANGTSLSTPLIGGLAALIKEARPGWSGADIRAALMATGTQTGAPDNDLGWGIARGWEAAIFGGGQLSPPRMTLPFALCEPADSASVTTTTPGLAWGESEAKQPGDQAQYTVHYRIGAGSDMTAPAGPDTSWSFPVSVLAPGDTVTWWVSAVGDSGYVRKSIDERLFVVDPQLAVGPSGGLRLLAPRPNPFRNTARFSWELDAAAEVTVAVFDVQGRRVWERTEASGPGLSTLSWPGLDSRGRPVPSGVYWVRTLTGETVASRKLIKLP